MNNKKQLQYLYDLGFIYELGSNIGSYSVIKMDLSNKQNQASLLEKIESIFDWGKTDRNFIIDNLKIKHNYKHRELYTDDE